MADRGKSRPRNKTAMAFAIGLTLFCALLFFLMANGTIFRAANGSTMGLVVGMAAIWLSGIGAFIAWWKTIDPMHSEQTKRETATIHRFSLEKKAKEDEKKRDIA